MNKTAHRKHHVHHPGEPNRIILLIILPRQHLSGVVVPRDGLPSKQAVAAMTRGIERLNAALLSAIVPQPQPDAPDDDDGPLPDRLRMALANVVQVCIPDLKDRYVATRILGLDNDGESSTLTSIGRDMRVTRERIRQRPNHAFRQIDSVLPRRTATVAGLRTVLMSISAGADWTNPAQAAEIVIRLVTDRFVAARQLTAIVCRAAGAAGPASELRHAVEDAVARAFENSEIHGHWRLDHWTDAAVKAVLHGPSARFQTPPHDMVGLKRMPENPLRGETRSLQSGKLGRKVACESGMELRVFSWLEDSPEVLWYQEQPIALPYAMGGRNRHYYPDAAVWDRDCRVIVVEVKPVYMMYRLETVAKAIAALDHLAPRGIGYLLVDSVGRTLAELAHTPYDLQAAAELEALFAQGAVPFRIAREIMLRRSGRIDLPAFASMVVNRDWAVSSAPVTMSKLPDGISFRPLIQT